MDRITIIIPAYNEERRIRKTLEIYSSYFETLRIYKELEYDILVVINNTHDRTEDVVKEMKEKNRRISYLNLVRGGKGFAVSEGFKYALSKNTNLIGFVDADASTPPDAFHDLIKKIGTAGGIIASRYLSGAKIEPPPTPARIIVSRLYNTLIRALFFYPYRDTQCGAKLFRREALERALPYLTMSHWAFDLDLVYNVRKAGFRIREIPTRWSDAKYSHINFMRAGPWMVLGVIRLRLLTSPYKDFVRIYDKLVRIIPR